MPCPDGEKVGSTEKSNMRNDSFHTVFIFWGQWWVGITSGCCWWWWGVWWWWGGCTEATITEITHL